jgi:nucleotide-binding universal stress UspA family protein
VAGLAQKLDAEVSLVHIIERNASPTIHGDRHLTEEKQACDYLSHISRQFFGEGIRVQCHVHTEETANIANGIVEHIVELSPALIVMCTHGKGGLRDLMLGSVAQQVVRLGSIPVLLIKPQETSLVMNVDDLHMLVAVDGNPAHERGTQVAFQLGQALKARMMLLSVVPLQQKLKGKNAVVNRMLPGTTAALLDYAVGSTREYLENLAAPWVDAGLQVEVDVVRGDPVEEIVRIASQRQVSMIVMGTHGKSGLDAFWAGSVAAQVTTSTETPILFAPVKPV